MSIDLPGPADRAAQTRFSFWGCAGEQEYEAFNASFHKLLEEYYLACLRDDSALIASG